MFLWNRLINALHPADLSWRFRVTVLVSIFAFLAALAVWRFMFLWNRLINVQHPADLSWRFRVTVQCAAFIAPYGPSPRPTALALGNDATPYGFIWWFGGDVGVARALIPLG